MATPILPTHVTDRATKARQQVLNAITLVNVLSGIEQETLGHGELYCYCLIVRTMLDESAEKLEVFDSDGEPDPHHSDRSSDVSPETPSDDVLASFYEAVGVRLSELKADNELRSDTDVIQELVGCQWEIFDRGREDELESRYVVQHAFTRKGLSHLLALEQLYGQTLSDDLA